MTKCYNCKGKGQAYCYKLGLVQCPVCGGTGKLSKKSVRVTDWRRKK